MKHLIIYSHLNPASFTKTIVDEVEKKTKDRGEEVKIIDLYGAKFNQVSGKDELRKSYLETIK